MNYQDFIASKQQKYEEGNFTDIVFPEIAFDFQKYLIEKNLKHARYGTFADTGLGKTIISLSIAYNIVRHTNKKVIIFTPLSVASQFIEEAEKLGIDDIEHSKNGHFTKNIVVSNYERIHLFNKEDFTGILLDESGILKCFDGKTKIRITSFMKNMDYRFLFTATPSPNDYIELGTSSEALGYMGYTDMLTKFFKNNNNTIKSSGIERIGEKWYLKPHAEKDFFSWVRSWSVFVKSPSDLGFSNDLFILPDLIEKINVVKNEKDIVVNGQLQLFNFEARSFREIKKESNATIEQRCNRCVELSEGYDLTVYWVNLNKESTILKNMDKDAVEVVGSMDIDEKEDILNGFRRGHIRRLITKPSITAFGVNWQHCNHLTVFPTYSFEQYYQLLRRFYRFGQKKNVIADIVISDGQTRLLKAIKVKGEKTNKLFNIINSKKDILESDYIDNNNIIQLPKFLNV